MLPVNRVKQPINHTLASDAANSLANTLERSASHVAPVNSKRLAAPHPAKAERFGRKAQKEPAAIKEKQNQINGKTSQDKTKDVTTHRCIPGKCWPIGIIETYDNAVMKSRAFSDPRTKTWSWNHEQQHS
jgi:hypothetical protein